MATARINTKAISDNWGGVIRLTLGNVDSQYAPSLEEITRIDGLIKSSLTGDTFYTFNVYDASINRFYQNVWIGLSDSGTPYIRTLHYFEDGQVYFIIYYFNTITTPNYNKKVIKGNITVTDNFYTEENPT